MPAWNAANAGRGGQGVHVAVDDGHVEEAHAVVETERGVVQALGALLGQLGEDVADRAARSRRRARAWCGSGSPWSLAWCTPLGVVAPRASMSSGSDGAHPVVPGVVGHLGQAERLQERREVHAEASPVPLAQAVPARRSGCRGNAPTPRPCRRPPASSRRLPRAAPSRPARTARRAGPRSPAGRR